MKLARLRGGGMRNERGHEKKACQGIHGARRYSTLAKRFKSRLALPPMTLALVVAALVGIEPLTAQINSAFAGVRPDPAPEEITRDTHYLAGNEWRLDLLAPRVAGTGGTYVGVGADQNYLLAGWARSNLVLLCDFDQWIVDLHAIYGVAFSVAATPDAFVDFWNRKSPRQAIAAIRERTPDPKDAQRLVKLYKFARVRVFVRLSKVRDDLAKRNVVSVLTSQEDYDHVRGLSRSGRIIATRADLTKPGALRQLADVLGEAALPVHVLYLSNAEQYFPYRPVFRANIQAWPASSGAIVVRTRPMAHDYTYVVQPLSDFREQLARSDVKSVRDLAPKRVLTAKRPVYDVPREPPMAKPQKLAKKKRSARPLQASNR